MTLRSGSGRACRMRLAPAGGRSWSGTWTRRAPAPPPRSAAARHSRRTARCCRDPVRAHQICEAHDFLSQVGARERDAQGGKVHGRVGVQCISRVIEGLTSRARSPWLPSENAGIASALFWPVSNVQTNNLSKFNSNTTFKHDILSLDPHVMKSGHTDD
jgi:hypothetical protein